MTDGHNRSPRIRILVASVLGASLLGSSLLLAAPSTADPDIADVEARVAQLYHEAEQASERYNTARVELSRSRSRLDSLHRDLRRSRSTVAVARTHLAALVVADYQGQSLTSTTRAFLSEDSDGFLAQLATTSAFEDQQTQVLSVFTQQAERLEARQEDAATEVAQIAAAKRTLAREKAAIQLKASAAHDLLVELERAREARRAAAAAASRSDRREARRAEAADTESAPESAATDDSQAADPSPPAAPAGSGNAAAAVAYARAQVGDSYVYGATGESAFDCSGLTMRAWAQAGVSLPHSSSAQLSSGTAVSQSELQPGDLVFYYSPVSHVGIYVGNGQLVHAANPSTGVSVTSASSMPFAGAVRPG